MTVRIVAPDFGNMIDLPGAGPCPRPVDLDQTTTGFEHLKSLRIYRFSQGVTIDGEAEGDEVLMTLVAGAADVALFRGGEPAGVHRLREDDGERAIYLPPHAAYRLTAVGDCAMAYARAQPVADRFPPPHGFAAVDGAMRIDDYALGTALTLGPAVGDLTGTANERLIHVRTIAGSVTIGDERLGDWDTAIVTGPAVVTVEGAATILTVSARPA